MGLSAAFNVQLHMPALRGAEVERVTMADNSFAEADMREVSVLGQDAVWHVREMVRIMVGRGQARACRGCTMPLCRVLPVHG
jgi:hypothetical protein